MYLTKYFNKNQYLKMKLNRLEAHDRLLHFKKDQGINIFKGAEECLKENPLSLTLQQHCPYIYIFAHPRTDDDGVTKRMLWQPRLTRPQAQTNSYLFRAISHTDLIEVCWLLPPSELWAKYEKGKITGDETILWCIQKFRNDRKELEKAHPEDLSDERIKQIYLSTFQNKEIMQGS